MTYTGELGTPANSQILLASVVYRNKILVNLKQKVDTIVGTKPVDNKIQCFSL